MLETSELLLGTGGAAHPAGAKRWPQGHPRQAEGQLGEGLAAKIRGFLSKAGGEQGIVRKFISWGF